MTERPGPSHQHLLDAIRNNIEETLLRPAGDFNGDGAVGQPRIDDLLAVSQECDRLLVIVEASEDKINQEIDDMVVKYHGMLPGRCVRKTC